MANNHGGSRPAVREDDKRLTRKKGSTKPLKIRFESQEQLKRAMLLTPEERARALENYWLEHKIKAV